jgi:homoserine dehydrogenase
MSAQLTHIRYPERPLIVQGSGAGAAVTASGVLGDLLKVGEIISYNQPAQS